MERDGLVKRSPDRRDPRRNAVRITPAGRRDLRRLETAVMAAQETILEPLPEADRKRLVILLQKLVEHHRGYRREAEPG